MPEPSTDIIADVLAQHIPIVNPAAVLPWTCLGPDRPCATFLTYAELAKHLADAIRESMSIELRTLEDGSAGVSYNYEGAATVHSRAATRQKRYVTDWERMA